MAIDGSKAQRWMNRRSTQKAKQQAFDYGAERGLFGKANPLEFNNRQQYERIAAYLHAAKMAEQQGMVGGPNPNVHGPQAYAPRAAAAPMPAGPQGPLSDMATIGGPRPHSTMPHIQAPWSRYQPPPEEDYTQAPSYIDQYFDPSYFRGF